VIRQYSLMPSSERGLYKAGKQRMRPVRARLELRMKLGADEERVLGELDYLDQPVVR